VSSSDATYLVQIDVTMSLDGGHLFMQHQQIWATAANKQRAARAAVRYIKDNSSPVNVLATKVVRIISSDQWGKDYFPVINAK
jgi:hypothetical protein